MWAMISLIFGYAFRSSASSRVLRGKTNGRHFLTGKDFQISIQQIWQMHTTPKCHPIRPESWLWVARPTTGIVACMWMNVDNAIRKKIFQMLLIKRKIDPEIVWCDIQSSLPQIIHKDIKPFYYSRTFRNSIIALRYPSA